MNQLTNNSTKTLNIKKLKNKYLKKIDRVNYLNI